MRAALITHSHVDHHKCAGKTFIKCTKNTLRLSIVSGLCRWLQNAGLQPKLFEQLVSLRERLHLL